MLSEILYQLSLTYWHIPNSVIRDINSFHQLTGIFSVLSVTPLSNDQDDCTTVTIISDNTYESMMSDGRDATSVITAQSSNESDELLNILQSDKSDTTSQLNAGNNIITGEENISICEPEERVSYLNTVCSKYNKGDLIRRYGLEYLYVNDTYQYVACLPTKAGCTTWKIILVNNTLKQPLPPDFYKKSIHGETARYKYIKTLSEYSKKQQNKILNEYYKFMVVRHPLDRLVSSYNDKVALGSTFEIRKRVVDFSVKNHLTSEPDLGAFFKYIIKTKANMDRHWAPATDICDPCNVKYDKIVKLETQAQDLLDVISHLGPYNRTNEVHANYKGSGAASTFSWRLQAYRNISQKLLADILALGFDKDMDLFGYSMGNLSDPLGLQVRCASDKLNCC